MGLFNINNKKYIILVGASGSGKNYIAHELAARLPMFYKVPQVTTRIKRAGELDVEDYIFLNQRQYEILKPCLIGKTYFNGNSYGSLNLNAGNHKGIIILDYNGLSDFLTNSGIKAGEYLVVLLNTKLITATRENRDVTFVNHEKLLNSQSSIIELFSDVTSIKAEIESYELPNKYEHYKNGESDTIFNYTKDLILDMPCVDGEYTDVSDLIDFLFL